MSSRPVRLPKVLTTGTTDREEGRLPSCCPRDVLKLKVAEGIQRHPPDSTAVALFYNAVSFPKKAGGVFCRISTNSSLNPGESASPDSFFSLCSDLPSHN